MSDNNEKLDEEIALLRVRVHTMADAGTLTANTVHNEITHLAGLLARRFGLPKAEAQVLKDSMLAIVLNEGEYHA